MPIAKLFIEGKLDFEVLNPILQGTPLLQRGGSKNSLKPRAFNERQENKVVAAYLRDRDFDFDPPDDLSKPTADSKVGWRWCRHEIENYLVEPAVVSEAMTWSLREVEDAIRQAARQIRNYEAARWTIGIVRRALPPHYDLKTRPDLNEIALPPALDSVAVNTWALNNIEVHRSRIAASTDPSAVQASLDGFLARFDEAFVAEVANVLLWFSGKDILAGMADWLATKSIANPGEFRAVLRDWIISNPDRALDLLPEWKGLIDVLRV